MKKWIKDRLNEGKIVQVAVTATNNSFWAYLTTSGLVCRDEYGFVEDTIEEWEETFNLSKMSWHSVKRLQKALINLYNN